MDHQLLHIKALFEKHIRNAATRAELDELSVLLEQYSNEELEGILEPLAAATIPDPDFRQQDWETLIQSILQQEQLAPASPQRPVRLLRMTRYAAAVVLILLGTAAYFYFSREQDKAPLAAVQQDQEAAPGRNGAILTLADGKQLVLDSLQNGRIADQTGTRLTLDNGRITYDASKAQAVAYNTMTTPRGRQFRLTLPDGTGVWLNAASSITYPTVFTGKERLVQVSGEVYFEVARERAGLFKVLLDSATTVETLGSSFNIQAYRDEAAIKTTLISGSVRVLAHNNSLQLQPGQQAILPQAGPGTAISMADRPDIEQVLAWKNGLFNFNGYNLRAVMREIGRWYDLDIVYEAVPEPGEVMGEIERDLSLSQVMRLFEAMHIKYRIEHKKLIILK
ncbi:MAG: DUF4974 domain-containing protein [Candidatus Pseudobacter hemicellulosilyticus]|uniref:DUF4974 domain-containing protein n=1 Tax=Candidatus Pseudobacter hemicellulosilyticus TaxID=3121375 RepID=A0AAJ5WP82_9BACT|nr:MAG: DUF4974 domain-containing protein [Pseudobacter sp.]